MTEDEYRRAHPEKIRMFDAFIDGFRDVDKNDILALVRRCEQYGVPCTGVVDQAGFDRLYDACRHAYNQRHGK